MIAIYTLAVSSVLGALAWRTTRDLTPRTARGLIGGASLLGIAAVIALTATPYGHAAHPTTVAPTAFVDHLNGSLTQQNGAGGSLLSVTANGTGARRVLVRVDLVTTNGQTVADTTLQLKDTASNSVCTGALSSFNATGFSGSCSFTDGSTRTVAATWQMTRNTVTGTLDVNL
jgi:hypothetical protein